MNNVKDWCHGIQIDGNNIENVNEYNYLGVYIDEGLDWNNHVHQMTNYISQRLGVVKRVRRYLTCETSKIPT